MTGFVGGALWLTSIFNATVAVLDRRFSVIMLILSLMVLPMEFTVYRGMPDEPVPSNSLVLFGQCQYFEAPPDTPTYVIPSVRACPLQQGFNMLPYNISLARKQGPTLCSNDTVSSMEDFRTLPQALLAGFFSSVRENLLLLFDVFQITTGAAPLVNRTQCQDAIEEVLCAQLFPRCSGDCLPVPPCVTLCETARRACGASFTETFVREILVGGR